MNTGQVTKKKNICPQKQLGWCGWVAGGENIVGLMAGLTGNSVLEVDDKIEDFQNKYNNNNNSNSDNNNKNKEIIDKAGLVVRGEENSNNNQGGEKEMAPPPATNSIHRSGSRPQLDLSKAAIQGNSEERNPTILLPNQSDDISHLALDIGGIIIIISQFQPFVVFLQFFFWG